MYRQILVDERDKKNQCIVWRDHATKPISFFQLQTVTYGTSAAPFLATRVIEELARRNKYRFPDASMALHRDMYVDDLMTGTDTFSDAIRLKKELNIILNEAGMQLRKWSSNSSKVLHTIDVDQRASNHKPIKGSDEQACLKLLGLNWNAHHDNFEFVVDLPASKSTTKRTILSESSKIFDPLGWLAPSTIRFKILLQSLWVSQANWDDQLPAEVTERWRCMRSDMRDAQNIIIPRRIFANNQVETIDIHAFCDASELAYAAAAYLRVKYKDGSCISRLIAAKTKVAPIKQISIPRLELCASLLLVKLVEAIKSSTTLTVQSVVAWTDSKIVLDWLSAHPRRWSTFVGNRTSIIIQALKRSSWRHVPTKSNPADCASRGISAKELREKKLWWLGPKWLVEDESHWPIQNIKCDTREEEKHANVYAFSATNFNGVNTNNFIDQIAQRYSNFNRIVRIFSWIARFINHCRRTTKTSGALTRAELSCSETMIFRHIQMKSFSDEIRLIAQKQPVGKNSKLVALAPFRDNNGVLRVGGRIENSLAPFETKHPIILPNNDNLVKLIIRGTHIDQGHAGLSLLSNSLKQRFWILRAKGTVREIIRKCVRCSRYQHRNENQIMAELPDCRVTFQRPFARMGVDYAGPLLIYHKRGRGQRPHKAYVALFICMSVKAVHMELVQDLTTDSFLAALRRFISRRGTPTDIFSDNGSNFVGANRELKEVYKTLNNNSGIIANFISTQKINWHFNPPNAPHFGGLWEAAVKSMKFHLKRIIGKQVLTGDELYTVLTQIEAIMNSRPLCRASNDEIDVLTPTHFLLGHPNNYIPETDLTVNKISFNSRWHWTQQICQHFWNRWQNEYLTTLQSRSKWYTSRDDIKINDVVLLKNENTPPSKWLLGRVQRTFPGADGKVRVVEIFMDNQVIKRPIHKLVRLPIEN